MKKKKKKKEKGKLGGLFPHPPGLLIPDFVFFKMFSGRILPIKNQLSLSERRNLDTQRRMS